MATNIRTLPAILLCAWILWGNDQTGAPWAPLDPYETQAACESARVARQQVDASRAPAARDGYSRVTRCWPVGLDPRGPKGTN